MGSAVLPSDFLCSNHKHAYVGCLADKDGLFVQVAHADERVAVRMMLDECAGVVPIGTVPRAGQTRELAVVELGDGSRRKDVAVWLEKRCLMPDDEACWPVQGRSSPRRKVKAQVTR